MAAIELATSTLFTDTALKAYYRFSSNLNDSSTSGYTLSNSNSSDTAGGKFGNGRNFVRASSQHAYLSAGGFGNINLTGIQTWGMWFSPVSNSVNYYTAGLRASGGGDYRGFFLNSSGNANFQIDGLTTNAGINSSNTFSSGSYNFVVGRYDGSQISIFLNGTWNRLSASGSGNSIVSNFSIGRLGDQNLNYYDGNIDDFWIFNRALSDDEVQYLYDGTPISSGSFMLNFI